ncbi:type II restriction endonuclease [Brevundimonas sp. FT23042]|uniref:type II restriction endonuclease n=1 Tax=Brevundimonas sp. FT23042 TaxID=3393749 RepID=UPI003B58B076
MSVEAVVDASLLQRLLQSSESVFVKKLSNNDRDWAVFANKHQSGIYVPRSERDGGFFPSLAVKSRADPEAGEIWESEFPISWPQVGEADKKTRLVNYRQKGEETHLTRLPKQAFSMLSPGSYLIIGRETVEAKTRYGALTIDSNSDDALFLEDALSLPVDFQAVVRVPERQRDQIRDQLLDFAELAIAAWKRGELAAFAARNAEMPDTATLAEMARQQYLADHNLRELNPFELSAPGDVVRKISREIELEIFRRFQLQSGAVALVRLIAGDQSAGISAATIVRRLIERVRDVDALMLSASQQRRSRAGYSFEHHIEAMLTAGRVPFQKQVIIEAKKRPDFILPSLKHLRGLYPGDAAGLILSAKTTLRERWKQVQREKGAQELFLATVDEKIASNAIEDMADLGIKLVVPESLKSRDTNAGKGTEYGRHENVLSFSTFFRDVLRDQRMPLWRSI